MSRKLANCLANRLWFSLNTVFPLVVVLVFVLVVSLILVLKENHDEFQTAESRSAADQRHAV